MVLIDPYGSSTSTYTVAVGCESVGLDGRCCRITNGISKHLLPKGRSLWQDACSVVGKIGGSGSARFQNPTPTPVGVGSSSKGRYPCGFGDCKLVRGFEMGMEIHDAKNS